MNLAAYLQMEVKPLTAYVPECEKRQKEQERKKTRKQTRNCLNANIAKHQQALARYAEAMRGEWVTTPVLEGRLGMSRSSCTPNLRIWLKKGLVERRKVGPSDNWNRRKGYEWRMVSPASDKG